MSGQGSHIHILCEDARHDSFVRRYLIGRGYKSREIYTLPLNGSVGSGEQSVRNRFSQEVEIQRKISGRTLIAVTDADLLTIQERVETLVSQIPRGKERRPEERIAILIPKRNIETWIYALNGYDMDEQTDYKPLVKAQDVSPAVIVLVERRESQPTPDPAWPPSLQDAYINELPRLNKP